MEGQICLQWLRYWHLMDQVHEALAMILLRML